MGYATAEMLCCGCYCIFRDYLICIALDLTPALSKREGDMSEQEFFIAHIWIGYQ